MDCLTLRDLRIAGYLIEIECIRCGAVEYRPPQTMHRHPPTAAVGALGLGLACPYCGTEACITSAAVKLGTFPLALAS